MLHCLTKTIEQRNGFDAFNEMLEGDAETLSLAARLVGVAVLNQHYGGALGSILRFCVAI